jgi:hypothetical protein
MVNLITSKNANDVLSNLSRETFWVPIQSDWTLHHTQNRISSMYIYDIQTENEYIVGFHSVDMDNIDFDWFMDRLPNGRRFCYRLRYLKTDTPFEDADMLVWYNTGKPIELDQDATMIFRNYHRRYKGIKNINDCIPIMKILEYCRSVRNKFVSYGLDYIHVNSKGYLFYNDVYLKSLHTIELAGICVDSELFNARYNKDTDPIVYTEYNPYTLTGRPSSRFGGINFNSLNKKDGSRAMIVSRFEGGRLFEIDYDSYHVRLIGNIIGFELPDGNLHEHFARIYFGRDDITPELYEKSKTITFQQLYGKVKPEYSHIEFFKRIQEFIDSQWNDYETVGYFSSPLSGRKFREGWFDSMNKSKMFNYIIQCFESEVNAVVLSDILQYLYQRTSKVIMYTYDAIVIDYDPLDGIDVIRGIMKRMTKFGYPVHIQAGLNYNDMIDVKID